MNKFSEFVLPVFLIPAFFSVVLSFFLIFYKVPDSMILANDPRLWSFILDIDQNGFITVSDFWLHFKWLYFYPGDVTILICMTVFEPIGNFLELNFSFYGGFLSGLVSFFGWLTFSFVTLIAFISVADIYFEWKSEKDMIELMKKSRPNIEKQLLNYQGVFLDYSCTDEYDEEGKTPLMKAVESGNILEVQKLLEEGANPVQFDKTFGHTNSIDIAKQHKDKSKDHDQIFNLLNRHLMQIREGFKVYPGIK